MEDKAKKRAKIEADNASVEALDTILRKDTQNNKLINTEQNRMTLYHLYLTIKEYKGLLKNDEYTIEEDGDVLIGKYSDRKLALQHLLRLTNRGILVSLVVK